MSKKQTSIKWLIKHLGIKEMYENSDIPFDLIIQQAKEIHKEEIITSYQAGDGDAYNLEETKAFGKQYYTDTYGQK